MSFECAIPDLAPACAPCGCWIVEQEIEANGPVYCCGYCAYASAHAIVDDAAPATHTRNQEPR